jgi:Tol biopolymer transport system component
MKHRSTLHHGIALALSAALLAGCSIEGPERLQLPSSFRLAPNDETTSMFETRVGKIAIARADGNIFVTDQTGRDPVMVTRDGDYTLDRQDGSITELSYSLPIWSPDATRLIVLESVSQFPPTLTTVIEGVEASLVRPNVGGSVSQQFISGTARREVTETETIDVNGASRISISYGGRFRRTALYSVVPDGKSAMKELLNTTESFIEFADWSPGGDQLGVLSRGLEGRTLSVVNADSGSAIDLVTGFNVSWSWNPDNTTLVAQTLLSRESPRSDVAVYATDNGEQLDSVISRAILANSSTRFSPDGNFMVYSQADEDAKEFNLVIADRAGKALRKLTGFKGLVTYAWSPAGAQLAFVERGGGEELSGPLRVIDVNSGKITLMTANPTLGFFWSPNGQTIAAFGPIVQASLAPESQALNLLPQRAQAPMLAQVIDVEKAAGRPLMYVELSEEFQRVLLQSDVYSSIMTIWAPNSRRLLIPIKYTPAQGASSVNIIIETESTGSIFPRELGVGSMASWSPK